jgi:C_GCAxxG_C_C family probable redox protein
MTKPEQAADYFNHGHHCAQAVLAAYGPDLGLPHEQCFRVAAAFGAGLGRSGDLCGAVSGALLVLGLRFSSASPDPAAKERTYAVAREFLSAFRERFGSLLCRELLGCDLSTPEGWKAAQEADMHHTVCPRFVAGATEILEGLLAPA